MQAIEEKQKAREEAERRKQTDFEAKQMAEDDKNQAKRMKKGLPPSVRLNDL